MIERILQRTGTERRLESKVWLFIASDPLSAFRQLFEAQGLLYILSDSKLKASTFCPQSVFIYLFFSCGWPNKQQLFPYTVCV